jgi:hypothetical protein
MTAITWGWGVEERRGNCKRYGREQRYADQPARKAALFVQQRREQQHPKRNRMGEGRVGLRELYPTRRIITPHS